MEDGRREFCTSELVKLELLPKPAFFRQRAEVEFYETHFRAAVATQELDRELGREAMELARRHGIAAMDALHLAAAIRLGAEEFFTAEKPGKPMFRARGIKVKSIHAERV